MARSGQINFILLSLCILIAKASAKCDTLHSWECASKVECIGSDQLCDGQAQCADGSDETFSVCGNFTCPGYAFMCSYGACVDGDAACNGVTDCIDRSDELLPYCKGVISKVNNPKCGKLEFACLDGKQCIPLFDLCDGITNCIDRSDETVIQCSQNTCPAYAFRCAYGACVDGDAACNSVQDCADNSDEFAPQCNVTGPSYLTIPDSSIPSVVDVVPNGPGNLCTLPAPPVNGAYFSYRCDSDPNSPECALKQGTKVGGGFDLHYECHRGYKLLGISDQHCTRAGWSPPGQTLCSDECEPIVASRLLPVCYRFDHEPIPCNRKMPARSYVKFSCKTAIYNKVSEPGYDRLVCRNGEWDKRLPEDMCQPACGRAVLDFAEPAIKGGTAVKIPEFPWHAGIYLYKNESKGYELNCGASLLPSLSLKVLLSAAHCFRKFDPSRKPVDFAPSQMMVGLGKVHRKFLSTEDKLGQIFEIKQVIVNDEYAGEFSNYASDIAIVILKKPVVYTPAVLPVCLDLGRQNIEESQVIKGAYGKVAGWGLTESDKPSDELLVAAMPVVPRDICLENSDLYTYVTWDKMCAGDTESNVTVCSGDSGGGLVFKHPNTNEHYLRGIVSAGTSGCSASEFSLFTKISKHKDFLDRYIHKRF